MMDDFGPPARTPAQQQFQQQQRQEMAASAQYAQSDEGKAAMAQKMREMEANEKGINKFANALNAGVAKPVLDAMKSVSKDVPVLDRLTGLIDKKPLGTRASEIIAGSLKDVGNVALNEIKKELVKEKEKVLKPFKEAPQKFIETAKKEIALDIKGRPTKEQKEEAAKKAKEEAEKARDEREEEEEREAEAKAERRRIRQEKKRKEEAAKKQTIAEPKPKKD